MKCGFVFYSGNQTGGQRLSATSGGLSVADQSQ